MEVILSTNNSFVRKSAVLMDSYSGWLLSCARKHVFG